MWADYISPRFGAAAIVVSFVLGSSPGDASRSCEASHIVGGGAGFCVLRYDGRVACWGDEIYTPPLSASPAGLFTQVAVGPYYSCGVRQDGEAVCWGKGTWGPIPEPQGLFKQIWVGFGQVGGLRPDGTLVRMTTEDAVEPSLPEGTFLDNDGYCGRRPDLSLECWDDSTPPEGSFAQLSGLCGLGIDGTIDCWGWFADQLGPPPPGTFHQLATAAGFNVYQQWNDPGACAVRQDGSVACWGDVLDTEPPAGKFREVAVGLRWAWGIRTDGGVESWPPWPPLETGSTGPLIGSFTQIAAGGDPASRPLSCAVDLAGKVVCWGNDQFGQASPPDGSFTQVAASNYHACGLRADGTIVCWGENADKDTKAPEGTFTQLAGGSLGPNCALRVGGEISCWYFGEPELAVPNGQFVQVTAGGQQACAIDGDGEPTCWRYVYDGDGMTIVMEPLGTPSGPFTQLSTSGDFQENRVICGVRPDGSIECWGDDVDGSLDAPDGEFVKVSVGAGGSCALGSDGRIECWGAVWNDGYFTPPEGEFVQVSSGYGFACGLTSDGSVVCTGLFDQTVSFCGPSATCGDGVLDEGETCDDGDVVYEIGRVCTDGCIKVPCGQPLHPEADMPGASDALFAMHTAVGTQSCELAVCDINNNASITVVDALGILTKAVDLPIALNCPL